MLSGFSAQRKCVALVVDLMMLKTFLVCDFILFYFIFCASDSLPKRKDILAYSF